MITVLIIDDEPLARRGVRLCLQGENDFRVVGESSSGKDGIGQIEAKRPDLVFLDVEMPGMSGFEMLSRLDPITRPLIVFLTAHEEYALTAFESEAMDYVLKPVDDVRFRETLTRARERIRDREAREKLERLTLEMDKPNLAGTHTESYLTNFAVRTGHRIKVVPVSSVSRIEAAGDYVTLHVEQRQFLIRESLDNLENQLDPRLFARVHRSRIVALGQILEICALASRDYELKLKDGVRIRASRRYKARIASRLRLEPR